MKCPHCAEEIQDSAIVCRFCGRDFQLFRPLLEKVQQLEKDMAVISEQLASMVAVAEASASNNPFAPPRGSVPLLRPIILMLSVTGFLLILWLFITNRFIVNMIGVIFPSVGGLLFGMASGDARLRSFVAAGVVVSLCNFVGGAIVQFMLLGSGQGFEENLQQTMQRWEWIKPLLFVVFSQTTTFTFASLFGQFINRRLRRVPHSKSAPTFIAATIDRLGKPHSKNAELWVEFWKIALGPLLTLVGTLVSAYLTYLASSSKPLRTVGSIVMLLHLA